jgi:DNA-directed RNA polymerase specialized sigma24 family protein
MLGWGEYDDDGRQEAWVALLGKGGDVDDPQAWVAVVARSKAVDMARSDKARECAEYEHAYAVVGLPVAAPVLLKRDRPWNRKRAALRAAARALRPAPSETYHERKARNARDWRARKRAG